MAEGIERKFLEMTHLLEQMPSRPAEKPDPRKRACAWSEVPCAQCGRPMPMDDIRYHWTGVLRAQDNLCRECQKTMRDLAPIVCVICKMVVARAKPMRLPSGFRIEAGKMYHTDACPDCRPGVRRTKLIEAEIFTP